MGIYIQRRLKLTITQGSLIFLKAGHLYLEQYFVVQHHGSLKGGVPFVVKFYLNAEFLGKI